MRRYFLFVPVRWSVRKQGFWRLAVAVNLAIAYGSGLRPIALLPSLQMSAATTPPAKPQPSRIEKKKALAPWSKPSLNANQVPQVLLQQWRRTGKRGAVCAALAPTSLGKGQGAKPRSANFGTGAWAIAYDKPGLPGRRPDGSFCANCGRGAFGIAGTGVDTDGFRYQGFPFSREWADGSHADYGLEGGNGQSYLAYLEIPNQRCLYNVWSFLGRDHLEYLLEHLRLIDTK